MVAFRMPASGKAVTDLTVLPTVSKSRKPRFELHLKIYDLNNIPLVSGVSMVKWQLPYSLHSEHRGRTSKHSIFNHRVEYNYAKIVPLRLIVDRNNRLSDYPIEFEITQEFDTGTVGKEEKVVLGKITLNLAEYVAESEAIVRDTRPSTGDSRDSYSTYGSGAGVSTMSTGSRWHHTRHQSSLSGKATVNSFGTSPGSTFDSLTSDSAGVSTSPSASGGMLPPPSTAGSSTTSASIPAISLVDDGVVRRYLMQDSKVNSTLKISILLVQVDGEKNFIAPALKTAPVFGGIAGIVANGEAIGSSAASIGDDDDLIGSGASSLFGPGKGREASEVHDVYRRALAASWACQSGELPADECIEDIFNGGDGFLHRPASTLSSTQDTAKARSPSGTLLGSVMEGSDYSSPSPTHSTINDKDPEETGTVGSGSSGGKKSSRIIPRMIPPMRRKGLPTLNVMKRGAASGEKGGKRSASGASAGADGSVSPLFESGSNNTSSEDDAGSGTGSANGNNNNDNDSMDINATVRPRDLRRFHGPPTVIPSLAFSSLRQHGRDESVFSDRTVTGRSDDRSSDMVSIRSSRSSPVPTTASSSLHRDTSYDSGLSAAGSRRSDSDRGRKGSSDARGGHPGGPGGHDHFRRSKMVDEYEVRDDFVAWQLPGSVMSS